MNFLSLSDGENVTSILPLSKEVKGSAAGVLMVTKQGTVKKVSAESFHDVRRSGIIAITLEKDDKLIATATVSPGDEALLVTRKGQSIRFKESDARAMGRSAGGVRGIRLSAQDEVVGLSVVSKKDTSALLILFSNGYGKKTAVSEYKVQKRGGGGVKTANVTGKTGDVMASRIVTDESTELVVISQKGQVIRVALPEIPLLGRVTQGVRIMKMREGDSIASFVCL
jgi:DNA gyrase subunit A